ncbi:MAG: sulfatase-like hydrolase/transferase, partial [Phycisphaerales bacterium]|nr:sulfatase-like hydrolase/transferase [Phycisphaerales bacterium]
MPFSLAILLAILGTAPPPGTPPRKPHVVLILADDLGSGDVSAMNPDSRIPTPNLDRIARTGARFTDAHSPSAVCTPTRYAILTGRYCWRSPLKSGVLWGLDPLLIEEGRPTIASELDEAGFHTAFVGKWHLGLGSEKREDW